MNDLRNMDVRFNQLGSTEDVEDWIYTHTLKKILANNGVPFKYSGDGNPTKAVNEIIKDFLAMIPGAKICSIAKSVYRSKMTYIIADVDNYDSYLHLQHTKRDKIEDLDFSLTTSNPDVMVAFEAFVKNNFAKHKKQSIHVIAQASGGGLTLHDLGSIDCPLVRDNYPEKVIKSFDRVVEEFGKKEPNGRLAVFNGPPGTGKTYLLRSLLGQVKDCIVVLLPSKLVGEIDSPALITLLAEEKAQYGHFDPQGDAGSTSLPILFIIEDADACLVPRESDNILTISSLLNYTDGILGSMLDLRVIATTNQERIKFDEALTRPGRMCENVYVGTLEPQDAERIYNRLTGKERKYEEKVSLAQVYSHANGSEAELDTPKSVLGFGVPSE